MEKIKTLYLKYEEIVNYIIVGIITTILSLLAYYIATRTFLDANNAFELQIANIIKWTVGVLFSFFASKKYVFKTKDTDTKKEFIGFVSSRFATLFLDMAIMALLVTKLQMYDLLASVISIVIVTVANYFLSKIFVFKNN